MRAHAQSTQISFATFHGDRGKATRHAFPSHTGGKNKGARFINRERPVGGAPGQYGYKALCGAYSDSHPTFHRAILGPQETMCKRCTTIIESAADRLKALLGQLES